MTNPELHVMNHDEFGRSAASVVATELLNALSRRTTVNLVLTGGSAAEVVYRSLTSIPALTAVDWARVRFFWGDERCVPPDHDDSNYRMANETLLTPLGIPEDAVFRMRGEDDPAQAADEYAGIVDGLLDGGKQTDVLLLGMGADGHTASLFPGTAALAESNVSVVANYVPKLKAWRLTMTKPVLRRARRTFVLVRGQAKASVLNCVFTGQCTENECPVRLLWDSEGEVTWLSEVPVREG